MASELLDVLLAISRILRIYLFTPIEAIQVFLPNIWPRSDQKRFNPDSDLQNLTGKVILVTGGNAGIGKETIFQLVKHDPKHIYMAARNKSKASQAINEIKSQVHDAPISWLPLDLSSLSSVREAAEHVNKQTDRLDILILNAGIMASPAERTETGHEIQLGTNHLGHFLLVKLLLPKLQATLKSFNSDVRIVSVASEACHAAPDVGTITSTEKLIRNGPWTRYGASKASNIMFAAELSRRFPEITSVSVHPGLIRTNLYDVSASRSIFMRLGLMLSSIGFVSIKDGAATQLFVAAGISKSGLSNGSYYVPYGVVKHNRWTDNVEDGIKLWEWTEAELKKTGN